jgi:hypothetical protein
VTAAEAELRIQDCIDEPSGGEMTTRSYQSSAFVTRRRDNSKNLQYSSSVQPSRRLSLVSLSSRTDSLDSSHESVS